ncbi:MAG: hypothetical protein LBH42_03020 [Treponema sp.]|jgi:hypothetical protein|nr:hypothetical protein [Treponema sp.]
MFDSVFNLVIILIPLAIFIGRIVVRARNKHAPPPAAPRIPVHFEDDEDEDEYVPFSFRESPDYIRELIKAQSLAAQKQVPQVAVKPAPAPLKTQVFTPEVNLGIQPGPSLQRQVPDSGAVPIQKGFTFNFEGLSPLKQAVVMAEILGPPKGMI